MRRIAVSVALLSVFAASCGPSPDQIQTAIAQTQAAIPTATLEPTDTPVPFTAADLELLLFKDGDLPEEFTAQQFMLDPGEEWGDPEIYRGVLVRYGIYVGDGVEVAVYSDAVDDGVFKKIGGGSGSPIDGLDNSGIWRRHVSGAFEDVIWVVWRRCTYAVRINFFASATDEVVSIYARRLDERLAAALCP